VLKLREKSTSLPRPGFNHGSVCRICGGQTFYFYSSEFPLPIAIPRTFLISGHDSLYKPLIRASSWPIGSQLLPSPLISHLGWKCFYVILWSSLSWEADGCLVGEFSVFYGIRSISSCSKEPASGLYPEPVESVQIVAYCLYERSRDSVVGIATGYGLDDRVVDISSPGRVKNFLHVVQTGSGVHPTSYPMATSDCFPGGKAAGPWSWPLTSS
jgi:hypothetical protein